MHAKLWFSTRWFAKGNVSHQKAQLRRAPSFVLGLAQQ
jgi:hypothetical protein